MTGHRRGAWALAWRVLVAYLVLTYLWRSLLILAALVALAVALVAASVTAVRALVLRRRGW